MTILLHNDRKSRVDSVVCASIERGARTEFVGTTEKEFLAIGSWLKNTRDAARTIVLVDDHTQPIFDADVQPLLSADGIESVVLRVAPPAGATKPYCSTSIGQALAHDARDAQADHVLSVGSGTLTDLGKIVARELGRPHVAVATAASMNGFTSSLSAVLDDGVKLTVPAPAPVAVFGHPDVLANAPSALTASGLGDLHSKPVSSADWRLSHLLNGSPWDVPVVAMLDDVGALMQGVAQGLHDRHPDAAAQLFAGLCLTGVAMQGASKGSQASGAEHLVSHYLDMIGGSADFDHDVDTHGAQVAVGCMVAIEAWHFVAERLRDGASLGEIPVYLYDPAARDAYIAASFRGLTPTIQAMHAKAPMDHPTREARRARIVAAPEAIIGDAMQHLPDPSWLRNELALAGCPTRFSELRAMTPEKALAAIRFAPWVRARYTILHLIQECGWYDAFEQRALRATY